MDLSLCFCCVSGYFHSVGPDPCCLPHPLAAPHPQVKVLVHNSAGRQVVDQDGGLGTVASPHMLPTASTKAVIQPAPDSRLGQVSRVTQCGPLWWLLLQLEQSGLSGEVTLLARLVSYACRTVWK